MGSRAKSRYMSVGRLSRLGDGEFFDYGTAPADDIPAAQMDWSGDYNYDAASGNWSGDSVYGSGAVVQTVNASMPPANPLALGLNTDQLVKVASGVYKYVTKVDPKTGKSILSPVKVANANGTPVSQSPMSNPLLLGGGFLLALMILKG